MRSFALIAALAVACEPDTRGHPGVDRGPIPSSALTVCAAGPTVKGVDVSHWNGAIDWTRAAASGQSFGIAKATEGVTFKDPSFQGNWAGMKSAGLVRGAYHFFRPVDDGAQQADFFLQTVGALGEGDLPPILDWEVTDSVSNAVDVAAVQQFVDEVRARTGLKTIVYTSASFLATVGNPTQFGNVVPLWDAHWGVTCPNIPNSWSNWTFWQYADNGSVPGIGGGVDLDSFNGTLADLVAMTGPGETTAPPDAGAPDAGYAEDAGALDSDGGPPSIAAASVGCTSASPGWIALIALLAAAARKNRRKIKPSRT
jgi:lysozyme